MAAPSKAELEAAINYGDEVAPMSLSMPPAQVRLLDKLAGRRGMRSHVVHDMVARHAQALLNEEDQDD